MSICPLCQSYMTTKPSADGNEYHKYRKCSCGYTELAVPSEEDLNKKLKELEDAILKRLDNEQQ